MNKDVTGIRDVGQAELRQLVEARAVVRSFHRESQSYQHLQRDYQDFLAYADGIRQIVVGYGTSPDLALDVEVEMNRRVIALLNSFKAFVDHTRHALTRRFGEASQELQDFDRACVAEYDAEFAYRLASRLRNYAQHRDLPIGYMKLRGPGRHHNTPEEVSMMCVRDQLLASGFDWKSFKGELEAQPDSWNLQVTIEQLMPCVARLRDIAIRPSLSDVLSAAKVIAAIAKEAGSPDAQAVIVQVVDPSPSATRLTTTLFAHHHAVQIVNEYSGHDPTDTTHRGDKLKNNHMQPG